MSNSDNIWMNILVDIAYIVLLLFVWDKIAKRVARYASKKLSRVLRRKTATA